MPVLTTVYRWLREDAAFEQSYTRARDDQGDTMADQVVKIADEPPELMLDSTDKEGKTFLVDGAAIQRQRMRIDARKWYAAKLRPKKYGDATIVRGDKDNPIVTETKAIVVPMKDAIGYGSRSAEDGVGTPTKAG